MYLWNFRRRKKGTELLKSVVNSVKDGSHSRGLCTLESLDLSLSEGSVIPLTLGDRNEPNHICSMPSMGVIEFVEVAQKGLSGGGAFTSNVLMDGTTKLVVEEI